MRLANGLAKNGALSLRNHGRWSNPVDVDFSLSSFLNTRSSDTSEQNWRRCELQWWSHVHAICGIASVCIRVKAVNMDNILLATSNWRTAAHMSLASTRPSFSSASEFCCVWQKFSDSHCYSTGLFNPPCTHQSILSTQLCFDERCNVGYSASRERTVIVLSG